MSRLIPRALKDLYFWPSSIWLFLEMDLFRVFKFSLLNVIFGNVYCFNLDLICSST